MLAGDWILDANKDRPMPGWPMATSTNGHRSATPTTVEVHDLSATDKIRCFFFAINEMVEKR